MDTSPAIHVILLEDDPYARDGIAMRLQRYPRIRLVAEANSPRNLLAKAAAPIYS